MTLKKASSANKQKKSSASLQKNGPLTILALPAVILLFVFNYIPLYGLVLPFKDYKFTKGFFGSEWVGFKNFRYLFATKDALRATRNTILYNIVFIVLGMLVSVLIALMLYEMSKRVVKVCQTFLLLPYFISWVVVSYIVYAIFDIENGLANHLLEAIGRKPNVWYNNADYWPMILTACNTWKNMGYNAIVYYAALMGINTELFEAARVDGASKLQQIWHISIPGLRPMLCIMLILNLGSLMNADFGLFYNVPQNSQLLYETTDVLSTYTFRALTSMGNVGLSAAASFYQSVVGFFLVVLTNWVIKRISPENSLF